MTRDEFVHILMMIGLEYEGAVRIWDMRPEKFRRDAEMMTPEELEAKVRLVAREVQGLR